VGNKWGIGLEREREKEEEDDDEKIEKVWGKNLQEKENGFNIISACLCWKQNAIYIAVFPSKTFSCFPYHQHVATNKKNKMQSIDL
jgi:hypothetical protein